MFYIAVNQLNKTIAWSNKCGGSSVRRQLLLDLNDPSVIENMNKRGVTSYEIVSEMFVTNPPPNTIPKNYIFEWYVRDPFYRTLSCFINRKIIVEKSYDDITFKDFIFNLEHFRSLSKNIKSHTEPQTKNYFDAPWNIIDIKDAKFNFKQKMNSTKYNLGDKPQAWAIPSKNLVINNETYSPISFYSKEIVDKLKEFYSEDYKFLKNKIKLI
jgi:hypothetical protein